MWKAVLENKDNMHKQKEHFSRDRDYKKEAYVKC